MSYVRRPFNPLVPRPNQVVEELNQANENFDILAQAFLNNDPTTRVLRSDVYTFRRVDLTNATSDYMLQVGEEAIINFTNRTYVPLRVALVEGGVYELFSPEIPQGSLLYPNNIAYHSRFVFFRLCVYWAGPYYDVDYDDWTGPYYAVNYSGDMASGFYFFHGINRVLIINNRSAKRMLMSYGDILERHIGIAGCYWSDLTTQWTSLGTIRLAWPISSYILVRRLA